MPKSAGETPRAGRSRSSTEVVGLKGQLAELYDRVLGGQQIGPKVGAVAAQIAGARIRLLETERRIKEAEEFEERLAALEQAADGQKRGGERWGA